MGIVLSDENVVVEHDGAKITFEPISLNALFELSGMDKEEDAKKRFFELILARLKNWEGVTDKEGKPVPCTQENFRKIMGFTGMTIIKKYMQQCGMTEEFEKNLGVLSQ